MSESPSETPVAAAVLSCPACGVAYPLQGDACLRCGGRVLPPEGLDDLAQLARYEPAAVREIVAAASPSEFVCGPCQKPMRHVALRGGGIGVCARCGSTFLPLQVAERLQGTASRPPSAPGARAAPRPPSVERRRLRWALAPFAGVVAMTLTAALVRESPLAALGPTLVFPCLSVLVPIAVGIAVRIVAPTQKDRAATVAVLVASLAVVLLARATTSLSLLNVGGLVVGVACALTVSASRASARRVVAGVAVGALATAGLVWVHGVVDASARKGCPDGARWVDGAGRHCALPDGTRHGEGDLRGSADVLLEHGTWAHGRRSGAFVVYHPSGAKRGEGQFVNDVEEGPWLFFGEDGTIDESGSFVHGKRQGVWTTYDERGEKQGVRTYNNDRLVP